MPSPTLSDSKFRGPEADPSVSSSSDVPKGQTVQPRLCKRLHQGIPGEEKGGGMDGQALLHVNTKEKDEQLCRSLQEVQTRKSWVTAPASFFLDVQEVGML